MGPAAGKSQLLILTVIDEVGIDEGSVVIRVYTQERKGQPLFYPLQSLEGPEQSPYCAPLRSLIQPEATSVGLRL